MKRSTQQLIAVQTFFFLAACSSSSVNEYGQIFKLIRQSLSGGFSKSKVTLKQAADIPYASMGWSLNRGPQQLVILATISGQSQIWTSSARIVLTTQDGRIKSTVGLPHDLTVMSSRTAATMTPPAHALAVPYNEQRIADFADQGFYNVIINCRSRKMGTQTIKILGKPIRTTRIDEICESPSLRWAFTDRYWVDSSAFVWRSAQHVNPAGDVLEIEIFRPPE